MSEICNKLVNAEKHGKLYLHIVFMLTVQKRFLLLDSQTFAKIPYNEYNKRQIKYDPQRRS